MRDQGSKKDCPNSRKQKLCGLWWPSLRSHRESFLLYSTGQSSHWLCWLKGRRQNVYLEYIIVIERMTPLVGGVSENLQPCFKTTVVICLREEEMKVRGRRGTHLLLSVCMDYSFSSKIIWTNAFMLHKCLHVWSSPSCIVIITAILFSTVIMCQVYWTRYHLMISKIQSKCRSNQKESSPTIKLDSWARAPKGKGTKW